MGVSGSRSLRPRRPRLTAFAAEQITCLASSGWSRCASVAQAVVEARLPGVTAAYLRATFSARDWAAAERGVRSLQEKFGSCRFAKEVSYGTLLVPDPSKLDTRCSLSLQTRHDQLGGVRADVFDSRLPAGRLVVPSGRAWTLVATVVGAFGPACGSYDAVLSAPRSAFAVCGIDTRTFMVRQIWGARVLQCGAQPPDCERNARWTFTLFAGEPLCDGLSESGTVLKGRVRFRLGRRDRGIGSARVAPALVVS
jgi:hypothetical protein